MFIIFPIPKMTVVYFKLSSFKYTFRREIIIFFSEAKIFHTKRFKLVFSGLYATYIYQKSVISVKNFSSIKMTFSLTKNLSLAHALTSPTLFPCQMFPAIQEGSCPRCLAAEGQEDI